MEVFRIIIPARDIEQSTRFYQILFDQYGERVSGGRHYFNTKNVIIAVYDPIADGDDSGDGFVFHKNQYTYFSVEDLERTYQRFILAGADLIGVHIEKMPWGETLFYASDPSGVPICFVQSGTEFKTNL